MLLPSPRAETVPPTKTELPTGDLDSAIPVTIYQDSFNAGEGDPKVSVRTPDGKIEAVDGDILFVNTNMGIVVEQGGKRIGFLAEHYVSWPKFTAEGNLIRADIYLA